MRPAVLGLDYSLRTVALGEGHGDGGAQMVGMWVSAASRGKKKAIRWYGDGDLACGWWRCGFQ